MVVVDGPPVVPPSFPVECERTVSASLFGGVLVTHGQVESLVQVSASVVHEVVIMEYRAGHDRGRLVGRHPNLL